MPVKRRWSFLTISRYYTFTIWKLKISIFSSDSFYMYKLDLEIVIEHRYKLANMKYHLDFYSDTKRKCLRQILLTLSTWNDSAREIKRMWERTTKRERERNSSNLSHFGFCWSWYPRSLREFDVDNGNKF